MATFTFTSRSPASRTTGRPISATSSTRARTSGPTPRAPRSSAGRPAIIVAAISNGNQIELQLETWTTTEEDPDTGCATEGTLTVFDDFEVEEAQGHMNILEIENFLDTDFDWGADGEIDERKFGEAALNLSALIEGALGSQCFSFGMVWMHTRSSDAIDSNLNDYITPESLLLRNCTASGTKFHDRNANGERDEGDDGLEGFRIFADYDGDGILDDGEPSDVTDEDGNYEITDIEPPAGTYSLREELEDGGAGPWICSYPEDIVDDDGAFPCGWFDIDADEESNAENKDFGNYEKASITLVKDLVPDADPGRFDLFVGTTLLVDNAGNNTSGTQMFDPGDLRDQRGRRHRVGRRHDRCEPLRLGHPLRAQQRGPRARHVRPDAREPGP